MDDKQPCANCPEFFALEGEHIVLVYTGGDPSGIFSRVGLALQSGEDGVVRRWRNPVVDSTGIIQYDTSDPWPPVPEGYETLDSDPHRLKPAWCPCIWRAIDVVHADTGLLVMHFLCINPGRDPETPGVGEVTLDVCRTCQIRKETMIDFDSE